ncbi:MAG: FKBP-type peptidyl-prolyl cis-trans isomerase [Erythrobacter sp.]
MAEITRVPLQPVAKGSLAKIWIGVIVAVLLGAGLAWAATPRTFSVDTITAGDGPNPAVGDMVFVRYKGMLASTGEVFDESQDIPLPVQGLFPDGSPFPVEQDATIEGFYQGLQQMQKGGKYELYIPADMAYGSEPPPGAPIPADADLIFEVEVVDFMSRETFDAKLMQLQQQMQSGMGAPGGPGGPPSVGPESAPDPEGLELVE